MSPYASYGSRMAGAITLVIALVGLVLGGCSAPDPPKHLVLLTVDTWRADHVLSTRAGVALTPKITELSSRSAVFTNASSVSNATSAGVAGFLTGLYPNRSGVISNDHIVNPKVPTLAAILSNAGFTTAGFVANPVVGPGYGFEQGFDSYELLPRPRDSRTARASAVNLRAMEWLGSVDPNGRAFLWLHYMEPHGPYQPMEICADEFDIDAFGDPMEVELLPEGDRSGRGGVPDYQYIGFDPAPTDGRDYLLRYAAEVRCVDAGIGEILDHLDEIRLLDDAVVVISADHGEALIDNHGFFFSHGNGLTQDQVAVPLVVHAPGDESVTIDRPVSTVDIVPTVLALLGLEIPDHLDGSNLLGPDTHPVFSIRSVETSVRDGRWKYIQPKQQKTGLLFDLTDDPAELNNLAATHKKLVRTMRGHLKELDGRSVLAPPVNRREVDDETREELRALGYISD